MSLHILWSEARIILLLEELEKLMISGKHSVTEYEKVLEPLTTQSKLWEQAFIICKLHDSGMKYEEIAYRLDRDYEYIKEICEMKHRYRYVYSEIKGARPFSGYGDRDENR